jgi:hypothetical protein
MTGFIGAVAAHCMRSQDETAGALILIGLSFGLALSWAVGAICLRGKFRAFCLAAVVPTAASLPTSALTLERLLEKLPLEWPPVLVDIDVQSVRTASQSLGIAILASLTLGHLAIGVISLAEKLRRAGVQPQLRFSLKTLFALTTVVGFVVSAAIKIGSANQTQFYVIMFCTGTVVAVVLALYIAALLVPPIRVRPPVPRQNETRPRSPW